MDLLRAIWTFYGPEIEKRQHFTERNVVIHTYLLCCNTLDGR